MNAREQHPAPEEFEHTQRRQNDSRHHECGHGFPDHVVVAAATAHHEVGQYDIDHQQHDPPQCGGDRLVWQHQYHLQAQIGQQQRVDDDDRVAGSCGNRPTLMRLACARQPNCHWQYKCQGEQAQMVQREHLPDQPQGGQVDTCRRHRQNKQEIKCHRVAVLLRTVVHQGRGDQHVDPDVRRQERRCGQCEPDIPASPKVLGCHETGEHRLADHQHDDRDKDHDKQCGVLCGHWIARLARVLPLDLQLGVRRGWNWARPALYNAWTLAL